MKFSQFITRVLDSMQAMDGKLLGLICKIDLKFLMFFMMSTKRKFVKSPQIGKVVWKAQPPLLIPAFRKCNHVRQEVSTTQSSDE